MQFQSLQDLPQRIKQIYSTCTQEEQQYLQQILYELSIDGESATYNDIWLADYKEIPVDKYTFLTSPQYLGSTNNNGQSIYPAWMDTMLELERTGNQYTEIVFTGATRTGKTSTAVSDALYHLYKLMCLRNPQDYFGLKNIATISIFFFNITQTLAKGVAFREFNDTIMACPWFLEHGTFTASETNPVYIPEGDTIEITYGSDASHALGKATFCLVGSTEILTPEGYRRIDSITGRHTVGQLGADDSVIFVDGEIQITDYVSETIKITLEDGTTVEGTPDHQVLLSTGVYVALGDLMVGDDLEEVQHEF